MSLLQSAYLALVSQPRHDRMIYACLGRSRVSSILEFGVGSGVRSDRVIQLALRQQNGAGVSYAGVDLFELRPSNSPGLSLRQAYCRLRRRGASVRLLPGDPHAAMSRFANSLSRVDLVIIGSDQDPKSLAQAWYYFPRFLHDGSELFLEEVDSAGRPRVRKLPLEEVRRRAYAVHRSARRAA